MSKLYDSKQSLDLTCVFSLLVISGITVACGKLSMSFISNVTGMID